MYVLSGKLNDCQEVKSLREILTGVRQTKNDGKNGGRASRNELTDKSLNYLMKKILFGTVLKVFTLVTPKQE